MINRVTGSAHLEGYRGRAWRAAAPRSQRQRLLGAVTHLAATGGYRDVTIGRIVAGAGVSRPTFYECFGDREECFAAALAPIAAQLLSGIREAVASQRPQDALPRATRALLEYACMQPAYARLLMSDTLTGGSELREVRDRLIDDAAAIVDQARAQAPAGAAVAVVPARLILGAACRMLATRLCSATPIRDELAAGLAGWIAAYEQPPARDCWRALATLAPPARSPFLPIALRAPRAPRHGGPRAADGARDEEDWLRIVFATAELIRRDGNAAASVARITAAAGVDSRAFYRLFPSKQVALAGAGELLFRHAIAAAAGAFVVGESWPERVWEAARALTQYADENPTLSHVSLVDCYGSEASEGRRFQDLAQAFTVFLQEGDGHLARSSSGSSEIMLEAISMGVFELCYRHVREDGATPLSSLLGQIAFVALAPFLGAQQASDFLTQGTPSRREHAGLAGAA
jgi:AcrR family transcriptional regulator